VFACKILAHNIQNCWRYFRWKMKVESDLACIFQLTNNSCLLNYYNFFDNHPELEKVKFYPRIILHQINLNVISSYFQMFMSYGISHCHFVYELRKANSPKRFWIYIKCQKKLWIKLNVCLDIFMKSSLYEFFDVLELVKTNQVNQSASIYQNNSTVE